VRLDERSTLLQKGASRGSLVTSNRQKSEVYQEARGGPRDTSGESTGSGREPICRRVSYAVLYRLYSVSTLYCLYRLSMFL